MIFVDLDWNFTRKQIKDPERVTSISMFFNHNILFVTSSGSLIRARVEIIVLEPMKSTLSTATKTLCF